MKTCIRYVLLKDDKPVTFIQTDWMIHSMRFTQNKREMFSFMCGYCTALGKDYSFDDYSEERYPDQLTLLLV